MGQKGGLGGARSPEALGYKEGWSPCGEVSIAIQLNCLILLGKFCLVFELLSNKFLYILVLVRHCRVVGKTTVLYLY